MPGCSRRNGRSFNFSRGDAGNARKSHPPATMIFTAGSPGLQLAIKAAYHVRLTVVTA
jgi:hypothetical protein